MSVDPWFDNNALNLVQRTLRPTGLAGADWSTTPVRDLLLAFGGWGGSTDAGSYMPEMVIVDEVYKKWQSYHQLDATAWSGKLAVGPAGLAEAINHIRLEFDPHGKLIIYGYSAGGHDAIELTWRIWREMRFYEYYSKSFHYLGPDPNAVPGLSSGWDAPEKLDLPGKRLWGTVRVDLLITVDAATGPASNVMNRKIPPCVRTNMNFYQTFPSQERDFGVSKGVWSHGGPNTAVDPRVTQIESVDLSEALEPDGRGLAHSNIDEATNDAAVAAILALLRAGQWPHIPPAKLRQAAAAATRPRSAGVRTHIVGKGESLSQLSLKYYGAEDLWPILYDANQSAIGPNPNLIQPTRRLNVPDLTTFTPVQLNAARQRGRSRGHVR